MSKLQYLIYYTIDDIPYIVNDFLTKKDALIKLEEHNLIDPAKKYKMTTMKDFLIIYDEQSR